MDRKSIVILIISFALLVAWYPLMNRLYPPQPPTGTNEVSTATNGSPAAAQPAAQPAATTPAIRSDTEPAAPEQTVVLENEDARYIFTSHGGGLKSVELKGYPAIVSDRGKMVAEAAEIRKLVKLNARDALPMLTLIAGDVIQNGNYSLSKTLDGVRAQKRLANGLLITKEFQLSTNYLIAASVRLENQSGQALALPSHKIVIGTATPASSQDDPQLMGVFWYDGKDDTHLSEGWFANRTLGCIPGTPRTEYVGGQSNVAWGAAHNRFFAIAAIPQEPAPRFMASKVQLTPPTAEELAEDEKAAQLATGYQASFVYPETVLGPSQGVTRTFDIFAGPKEYNTLARLGSKYGNDLDLVMELSGFFGWFSKALLLSMNGLHALGFSYGWAIVVITILIKLLFWPLTKASTRSMKRMAALQPQMKAIQEKYKEDPQKMNTKLMEFMKENKVNPLGGCLPMLLQMPVFFGFFFMIKGAIELRGAEFLWICDLSSPDTVALIPGLNFPINPMPILMGITMLWQARLTPVSPGMDPVQQKIMKYLPLMFVVFLYTFSAGLTLYWTVQNLLTIAQMKLTRNEPAETATAAKPAPAAKPVAPKPFQSPKKKKK